MPKPFVKVELKGFKGMSRKMDALLKAKGYMGSGLIVSAETIKTDVENSRPGAGIPKDEGVLAASLRVGKETKDGAVHIRAGGAAAPYALYQHEVTTLRHKLGEARYFIRGVERFVADGEPEIALQRVIDLTIANAKREA